MKVKSAEVKYLDPIETIAITHLGDYSGIGGVFEELAAWATTNDLWDGGPRMIGVYLDNPMDTPAEKLRSRACLENLAGIPTPEGMESHNIMGGKYFVTQVEVTMAEYGPAWQMAYAAFNEKGYEYDPRDRYPYELYLSCAGDTQDADAPWVVDLCIPMK